MPKYYEFEVSLLGIRPRIWRRFQIPEAATFADLHFAIYLSFGWGGGHLWEFLASGRGWESIAGLPRDDDEYDVPDADAVKLRSYFRGQGGRETVQISLRLW